MAGLLQRILRDRSNWIPLASFVSFVVAVVFPKTTQFIRASLRTAYIVVLYSIIAGGLLQVFLSLVLLPLLSWLRVEERTRLDRPLDPVVEAQPRPQSRDEESLVVESSATEPRHDWSGFISRLYSFPGTFALVFGSAIFMRPEGTSLALGTLQYALGIAKNTSIGGAVVLALLLLASIPLVIVWVIVERIITEPYKASTQRFTAVCTGVLNAAFLYLLALEGMSLSTPSRHFAIVQHLTWQATPLAHFFKWAGLSAYTIAVMWLLTDWTAGCLLHLACKDLSIAPPFSRRSWYQVLIHTTRFILFPLAMALNGRIYTSTAPPWDEFVSAAILITWITLGAVIAFLFDLFVYWAFFFWTTGNAGKLSTIQVMAATVFSFVVDDMTGREYDVIWTKNHEADLEKQDAEAEAEAEIYAEGKVTTSNTIELKDEIGLLSSALVL